MSNNNIFKIHVDDKFFTLTRKTIESYPDGLLAKAINNPATEYKYVVVCHNNIYVDRDPKSFSYVIDRLRNYEICVDLISDDLFRKKVIDDLDYFDLYCNFNTEECDIKICDVEPSDPNVNYMNNVCEDTTNNISKNQEMIKQYLDKLVNQNDTNNDTNNDSSNPLELMQKLSNNEELTQLIKTQNSQKPDSSSSSLDFSEDEDDYELV